MAVQRFYYSDTITDFLSRNDKEIVADLALASQHAINDAMEEVRWSHEFTEIRTHEIRTE